MASIPCSFKEQTQWRYLVNFDTNFFSDIQAQGNINILSWIQHPLFSQESLTKFALDAQS